MLNEGCLRAPNQPRLSIVHVHSLPPEILAIIFHHATSLRLFTADRVTHKNPSRTSPILLGVVCSYWRQVALSTPNLWTYIDPVPIRGHARHSDATLLRLHFKNASTLLVALQIKLDCLSSSRSAVSEEILRVIFTENSHKIGILVLSSRFSLRRRWAMLAPKLAQSQFPNLNYLEVDFSGAPLSRFDSRIFAPGPHLFWVVFNGYHLPHETFWGQLTVLDLAHLPVNQCLETLVRCPNLINFHCFNPRPSDKSIHSAMNEYSPVILQHLREILVDRRVG